MLLIKAFNEAMLIAILSLSSMSPKETLVKNYTYDTASLLISNRPLRSKSFVRIRARIIRIVSFL